MIRILLPYPSDICIAQYSILLIKVDFGYSRQNLINVKHNLTINSEVNRTHQCILLFNLLAACPCEYVEHIHISICLKVKTLQKWKSLKCFKVFCVTMTDGNNSD